MSTILESALGYAEAGWRVVPIRPGTKVPPMKGWQHAATNDPAKIRKWWEGLYPNAGVGIATGQESGVWVLDIDADHGGIEALKQLTTEHGALPKGPRCNTPSGGFHLYFANPPGLHVSTTKNIARSASGDTTGIDVRGDGGQVLAPPTVHPNGGIYEWAAGRSPEQVALPVAPEWLLALVAPPEAPEVPPVTREAAPATPAAAPDGYSAAEEITRHYDWHKLLSDDGWQISSQTTSESRWVRPGKDPRLGISAVLHEPDGPFVNYSTEARTLTPSWAHNSNSDCWSFSIFGYLAATRFNGDRSALAKDWTNRKNSNAIDDWVMTSQMPDPHTSVDVDSLEPATADELAFANLVDWGTFWTRSREAQKWALWPLVPVGRAVALFAPAKAGKSTIILDIAAAAATGRPILGQHRGDPVSVLYLDYEMTEDDLFDRLQEHGYDQDADLTNLHYALLPMMFPLDSKQGAEQIVRLAKAVAADVVVIDTFSRAVQGDENDADTTRDFYRHTGMALKSLGIACLRTDHAGKDVEKGQRGSSAKNDDVDVVWSLTRAEQGVKIVRTHSRMSWVDPSVHIDAIEHDDGTVAYRISGRKQYADGTADLARLMDKLGVPLAASAREAGRMLREAGEGAKNERIRSAQQYRQSMAMTQFVAPPAPVPEGGDEDSLI